MVSQRRAESIWRLEAIFVMELFPEPREPRTRSVSMTRLWRRVNNRAAPRQRSCEFGDALDRDGVGGREPTRRKRQQRHLQIGRQQLQPSVGHFVLDNRGRNTGYATAFD